MDRLEERLLGAVDDVDQGCGQLGSGEIRGSRRRPRDGSGAAGWSRRACALRVGTQLRQRGLVGGPVPDEIVVAVADAHVAVARRHGVAQRQLALGHAEQIVPLQDVAGRVPPRFLASARARRRSRRRPAADRAAAARARWSGSRRRRSGGRPRASLPSAKRAVALPASERTSMHSMPR